MIADLRSALGTGEHRSDLGDLVLWLGVLGVAGLVGAVVPLAGAAVDGLIILWLSLFARSHTRWAAAAAGLALVPLLRLLWLAMPIDGVPWIDWIALIAPPFLAATVLVARQARLTLPEIGVRLFDGPVLAAGAVAGWAVGGFVLARIAGDAVAWGQAGAGVDWARVVVYALIVAIAEELAFRGVLPAALDRLVPRDGMWLATMASAILCLGATQPWWVLITLVVAGVNGMVMARTRSLAPVIVGHAVFLVALNL